MQFLQYGGYVVPLREEVSIFARLKFNSTKIESLAKISECKLCAEGFHKIIYFS